MKLLHLTLLILPAVFLNGFAISSSDVGQKRAQFLGTAEDNAKQLIEQGRNIFRFDTYGDEAFWTGQLQMQHSVNTLAPRSALTLGLKVDSEALSPSVVEAIKHGNVNLNDPAVRLQLIKQNAVLGVVGTFNNNTLSKIGFTCALCHSTVDNSVVPGIGKRLDGLANRDLNVGAIIATAPNLQPVVNLLRLAPQDASITMQDVRNVLNGWGPASSMRNCSWTEKPSTRSRSQTVW